MDDYVQSAAFSAPVTRGLYQSDHLTLRYDDGQWQRCSGCWWRRWFSCSTIKH